MPGTSPGTARGALVATDRAWDVVTGPLGAPPPDGGLDHVWRVYLVDGQSASFALAIDPRMPFDRASSFALVDRSIPPGCALDRALARAVVRGAMWRAAPATDSGSAEAEAEELARLATPCETGEDDADVAAFQAQPGKVLVDPFSSSFDRGAATFFAWLDATYGAQPGALVVGLWALAPTKTPPGASRWTGTPTGFDVLRVSLADALWQGSTLDDVFVRFATVRASMVPPPRLAWHVPWPEHARRLGAAEPTAPTGAAYVAIDRAGAPVGARLRVEAEWEDYARMRWVVVKLDSQGRPIQELPITSTDRATRAALTVENLDGTDRVVVVGVDIGSTEHPFDPDQGEWEPHGWLLTLAPQ
jgi:hypothetical protein